MSTAVRKALYNKLSGDGTLNGYLGGTANGYYRAIYFEQAPQGAGFPCVIFSRSSGVPVFQTFGTTAPAFETDTEVWMFKAVDQSTMAGTAELISARMTELLHGAPPTITAGSAILYVRRESDIQYSEVTDGSIYHHVGSLYRVIHGGTAAS